MWDLTEATDVQENIHFSWKGKKLKLSFWFKFCYKHHYYTRERHTKVFSVLWNHKSNCSLHELRFSLIPEKYKCCEKKKVVKKSEFLFVLIHFYLPAVYVPECKRKVYKKVFGRLTWSDQQSLVASKVLEPAEQRAALPWGLALSADDDRPGLDATRTSSSWRKCQKSIGLVGQWWTDFMGWWVPHKKKLFVNNTTFYYGSTMEIRAPVSLCPDDFISSPMLYKAWFSMLLRCISKNLILYNFANQVQFT